MSYTVNQLISDAYYMADIVSREFESVSGVQAAEGLRDLNFLLDMKTVDKGMIPYISTYDSTFVIGQEEYFIDNLIEVDTLTYTINDVRFTARKISQDPYFGSARANNIESLPFSFHSQREFGGARLYVYFKPDNAYPFQIKGLFRLAEVTQFQDISLTVDKFYINYLTYELAEMLCEKYAFDVPINVLKKLSQMREKINNISQPIDMSVKRISALSPTGTINYAYANLGTGFMPGKWSS